MADHLEITPDVGFPGRVFLNRVISAEIFDTSPNPNYTLLITLEHRVQVRFGFNTLNRAKNHLKKIK